MERYRGKTSLIRSAERIRCPLLPETSEVAGASGLIQHLNVTPVPLSAGDLDSWALSVRGSHSLQSKPIFPSVLNKVTTPRCRKGALKNVQIVAEQRQGRKKVTKVTGLEVRPRFVDRQGFLIRPNVT